MSKEERLLRAIFSAKDDADVNEVDTNAMDVDADGDDGLSDNYPETYFEKAHYAQYLLHKSLENLSPTLNRLSRLKGLLQAGEAGGKNCLPSVITHGESRKVLIHLAQVKDDVNDAHCLICRIFKDTKNMGTKEADTDV